MRRSRSGGLHVGIPRDRPEPRGCSRSSEESVAQRSEASACAAQSPAQGTLPCDGHARLRRDHAVLLHRDRGDHGRLERTSGHSAGERRPARGRDARRQVPPGVGSGVCGSRASSEHRASPARACAACDPRLGDGRSSLRYRHGARESPGLRALRGSRRSRRGAVRPLRGVRVAIHVHPALLARAGDDGSARRCGVPWRRDRRYCAAHAAAVCGCYRPGASPERCGVASGLGERHPRDRAHPRDAVHAAGACRVDQVGGGEDSRTQDPAIAEAGDAP